LVFRGQPGIEENEMRAFRIVAPLLVLTVLCISDVQAVINVSYDVNTFGNKTPISKYVYGSNWGGGTDYTIRRSGGNRLTAYNWENNFSNAGSDYGPYHNDDYMSPSQVPGKAITDFHNQALSQGQASIVTLQMAGYVAADENGNVNLDTEAAPSARFRKVVFAKGAPFCSPPGSPVTNDANVYMDEFVNFLVYTYGYAGTANGVKFYDLDNEPDIWSDGAKGATHPEVHVSDPCCLEYKDKSTALSTAVKNVDPNAQIMGPVSYGFGGYLNFQGASDWGTVGSGYDWFLSYYLHKMGIDSNTAGKRLLDALDVHWYPEAQDDAGHRILENITTTAMYNARMQAPRTLWDTGYIYPNITYPNGEVSWINQWYFVQYLPLIPRLKNDIKNYYPDTNIAITEYAYGPDSPSHWSTGIATTDFLGILGKYGVYIATYWGGGTYVDAAIKIYRNYDGAHSTFGDVNVIATMSNKVDSSIYGSLSSVNSDVLHMVVINKNQSNDISGTFTITSGRNYTSGSVWAFDSNSYNITQRAQINNITNNSFTYTISKTSVYHIVLTSPSCPQYELTGDCHVDMDDLLYLFGGPGWELWLYQLYPDECGGDPLCPDINGDLIINFRDFALLAQGWGM
jgi:mannan endo-1,4-beta-mannosidase